MKITHKIIASISQHGYLWYSCNIFSSLQNTYMWSRFYLIFANTNSVFYFFIKNHMFINFHILLMLSRCPKLYSLLVNAENFPKPVVIKIIDKRLVKWEFRHLLVGGATLIFAGRQVKNIWKITFYSQKETHFLMLAVNWNKSIFLNLGSY